MKTRLTVNVHLFLNEYTEQTAYDNLTALHEMGLHVTTTSPKPLPERFYEVVDVFLHDKENQILEQEYGDREPVYYYTRHPGFTMNFQRIENQRHGLAVLRSMVKGCELAKMYDNDWILRIEFDDILSKDSVEHIRQMASSIEEDFMVFRNDYGNRRDLSVHTMLYRPDAFLRVFGDTKDEENWITSIKDNCDYGNPILEELMLHMLEKSSESVLYLDGKTMSSVLPGSVFNLHQSPSGLVYGCLTDLMSAQDGRYFGAWAVNPPGGKVRFVEEYSDGRKDETHYDFLAGFWAHKKVNDGVVLAQIFVNETLAVEYDLTKEDPNLGSSLIFNQ